MAQPKPVSAFELDSLEVKLGKISNNIEMHGTEEVIAYDVPFEGLVPPKQLEGLLGEYCDRTMFNTKAELVEPSELFKHTAMPLSYDESLTAKHVRLVLSDNVARDFGGETEDDEGNSRAQLCPISKLRYEPKPGGLVWIAGSIRLRPSDEAESWALLQHQHRSAKLSVSETAIALKKGAKQQELALSSPEQPSAAAAGDEPASPVNSGEASADSAASLPAADEPNRAMGEGMASIGPKTRAEIAKHAERTSRRGRRSTGANAHN